MKQLTCEICGNTDLIKQDGVFVCQACGCKYSIEEAKKMLVEIDGAVQVQNAPQLENLLNMAKSSFDSKNYSKAEDFCNQVIAMDDKNHEAWKLKGEAINYQISTNNQRILEVYNCIMTSYRVLSDEDKEDLLKKKEILSSLKDCFEGEVDFWLKQFEANRPTDEALIRAKNAYMDAYSKMAKAFDELGLEESKVEYLGNLDNFFVNKCNAICNAAWKSTVAYNYYRDYMGKGIDPFSRKDRRWIIANTDIYRPTDKIWLTFIKETSNLVALLQFAEEQFNDETDPDVMEAIFSNIAYFGECIIPSGSWKITQGYTSNWDQYQSVGWAEESTLTDSAKEVYRSLVEEYNRKGKAIPAQARAKQEAKKEKERKERIAKYYEEHSDENKKRLSPVRDRISKFRGLFSAGENHTVGLKSDSTVVATKYTDNQKNYHGQCDVEGWGYIVAVSAGVAYTVGLKADGTVVATKYTGDQEYYCGQCDVEDWTDIVTVSAGGLHTIGLKSDGTVVATKYTGDQEYYHGQCDVEDWTDIVTVSAGGLHTIGLKSDGTVVATKYTGDQEYYHGQCDIEDWTDIVAVSAGYSHTIGLKSDGMIVAVGENDKGQCDIEGWTDIVAVSAGGIHTVGLM